eukprot:TRINITY_DN1196_c0_g1_i2.p1 TRINITY_DN1196_c0_g1~~TRINITY_DN1196_c0_g1_i2.p1  ORF type:complete len:126 (+),score=6.85 TRINITY_DN1196_c0_g1_i2:171-548(+)
MSLHEILPSPSLSSPPPPPQQLQQQQQLQHQQLRSRLSPNIPMNIHTPLQQLSSHGLSANVSRNVSLFSLIFVRQNSDTNSIGDVAHFGVLLILKEFYLNSFLNLLFINYFATITHIFAHTGRFP